MADQTNDLHPLTELAGDEALWQKLTLTREIRLKILGRIAAGEPALSFESLGLAEDFTGNAAFATRQAGGTTWLVPQRFLGMVDFFLHTPATPSQDMPAAEALACGDNCLLTGGPGTGKSYHIAALISHLAAQKRERPLRVTVAAPTGKAAARFAHLRASDNLLLEWSTIHRLLGLGSELAEPRYHAQNPLGCDLLVIDEISMLDLGLFSAVINALPRHARLVIAGDLAQLPAVDGMPIDACLDFLRAGKLVRPVNLTKVYRFSAERSQNYAHIAAKGLAGIGENADGIALRPVQNSGELGRLLDLYARERFASATAAALRERILNVWQKPEFAAAANEVFTWLKKTAVLTTRREGPNGSVALNSRMHLAAGSTNDRTLVPLIAGINNYRLGIFNGDTGFILTTGGKEYAVMDASQGETVVVPLSEMGGWEMAYAITVHKSQGSEYDDVLVVYEKKPQEVKEDFRLLYTAVTRAKNQATVLFRVN